MVSLRFLNCFLLAASQVSDRCPLGYLFINFDWIFQGINAACNLHSVEKDLISVFLAIQ